MFQCESSTEASPQCVASYDKCNGVRECLDGSDEANCTSTTSRHGSEDAFFMKNYYKNR